MYDLKMKHFGRLLKNAYYGLELGRVSARKSIIKPG
jgi:hypothetical protein